MKKIILLVLVLSFVQGCTREIPELKSPCVGVDKSPCGPRVPVNAKWIRTYKT